jgi:predicted ester cyclase
MMDTDRNKELIRRWLAFGEGGFDGDFDEFIDPDYVGHSGGGEDMDRATLERLEHNWTVAFGDVRYRIDDLIAEGDRVVLRVESSGTHRAEYVGIPATGKRITQTGIVIYRIAGGRIAESWSDFDFGRLVRQLRSAP